MTAPIGVLLPDRREERRVCWGNPLLDVVIIAGTAAFFAALALLARAVEKL